MKAILCHTLGAPPECAEVPSPDLRPGCVRIRVAAAGMNFADGLMIAGRYQDKRTPPFIPGLELSGTVIEITDGVTTCSLGDRVVAACTGGAFAEEAVVAEHDVWRLPNGLDLVTAAGFPVAYGTSHFGLKTKATVKAGETLVVHGAAGGVGLTAVEVGVALGARVIATAGGVEKQTVVRERGASFVIDYKTESVRERILELTDGHGADVVYDPVGGTIFQDSLHTMAPDGRILVVGFASGTIPAIAANLLLVKNVTVIGYWWGAYRKIAPHAFRESLEEALTWWEQGRVKPHVSTLLPLEEAAHGLELLRGRGVTGKIVLRVD